MSSDRINYNAAAGQLSTHPSSSAVSNGSDSTEPVAASGQGVNLHDYVRVDKTAKNNRFILRHASTDRSKDIEVFLNNDGGEPEWTGLPKSMHMTISRMKKRDQLRQAYACLCLTL